MTTAPSATAMGASRRLASPPAENRAMSTSLKAPSPAVPTACSAFRKATFWPDLDATSRGFSLDTGKPRCSRVRIISAPTAPSAPTTATT
jgi:hypothetical protein